MGWFPCAGKSTKKPSKKKTDHDDPIIPSTTFTSTSTSDSSVYQMLIPKEVKHVSNPCRGIKLLLNIKIEIPKFNLETEDLKDDHKTPTARPFTFRELKAATKNFRDDCFLGQGRFGKVYKGRVKGIKEVVAIKHLYSGDFVGREKFLVKVLMLSSLHHPNLVNLIGYCADGDHRLLVYEYMPLGSLKDHLHDFSPQKLPLDWNARMRIAAGAARGLEYLHDTANPPVICRELKSSKILLGEGYHPKLSYFDQAVLGPTGDKCHVSSTVMFACGYSAPEYAMTGWLTTKSDIYSFGVILLEIITGRKAIDETKPEAERILVAWARPLSRDTKKISQMVDPKLEGLYSMRHLCQAVVVAQKCVQEHPRFRPTIADVVVALSYLASQPYKPELVSVQSPHSALSNSPPTMKVYT